MFAQVQSPDTLEPDVLDGYLENGWFRMGQTIFTTNFLHFKNQFYSAVWLRVALREFSADATQKKLFKLNVRFRNEIRKASITPEKEALYKKYKQGISFETSSSLKQLLYGKVFHNVYNSFEVEIFDGDHLIAVGIFDVGATAAAGITSFYDPDYKKYSLGKYLIYLKIEYCLKIGLLYFYPGYFVPGYSYFDYKLTIGRSALHYLELASSTWRPLANFQIERSPLTDMHGKLSAVRDMLIAFNIQSRVFKYEFFDANLIPELKGAELFDFPLFLWYSGLNRDEPGEVVVYDVRSKKYVILKCSSVWKTNVESVLDDIYSVHVLKADELIFSTGIQEDLKSLIFKRANENTKTGSG